MRIKRREMLLGTAAALVVPGLVLKVAPQMLPSSAGLPEPMAARGPAVGLVVYESGVPAAEHFAAAWPSQAAQRAGAQNDVGSLLYQRLVPSWREQGVAPMAGLTGVSAFFCLTEIAAEHGLRLIHRGVHGLEGRSPGWPAELAHSLAGAIQAGGPWQVLSARQWPVPHLRPQEHRLVSWVLLPRALIAAAKADSHVA